MKFCAVTTTDGHRVGLIMKLELHVHVHVVRIRP